MSKELIEQLQRDLTESLHAQDICHQHRLGEMEEQLTAANKLIEQLVEAVKYAEGAFDEARMYQNYPITYDLIIEALAAAMAFRDGGV